MVSGRFELLIVAFLVIVLIASPVMAHQPPNGDFENGFLSPWEWLQGFGTFGISNAFVHSGSWSVDVTSAATGGPDENCFNQTYTLTQPSNFSFWYYTGDADYARWGLFATWNAGYLTVPIQDDFASGAVWHYVESAAEVPPGTGSVGICAQQIYDSVDDIWFDDITFDNITEAPMPPDLNYTVNASQIMYATPHPVKFIVRTLLGYPVMNATVNATYMETSGPLDWLLSWFGVPTNVDIQNTTMSGHTGLDGAIVFSMVPVVKYNVSVISDSGNASLHDFYPKDDEYTIWLGGNLTGNLSGSSFFEHGHDLIHDVGFVVNGTETAPATGDLGVSYYDLLNSTVQCYVTVNQSHSYGNYTNETTVDVYGYTPAGTSNFSHIFNLLNQRDQSYLVHLMCNHTIFGNFTRDAGVTYPPGPVSLGIPEDLLVYVGMGGIFFIVLCFTRTLPGPAVVISMFFAWIFYYLKWWRELAPENIVVAALIAFSTLAIMYNIMLRSKKQVYE